MNNNKTILIDGVVTIRTGPQAAASATSGRTAKSAAPSEGRIATTWQRRLRREIPVKAAATVPASVSA